MNTSAMDALRLARKSVDEAMVERALRCKAFREDGARWPDAYSEDEQATERANMLADLRAALAGDGPMAYCRACQETGARNCGHFNECEGATCVTCHQPLNTRPGAAAVQGEAVDAPTLATELSPKAIALLRFYGEGALRRDLQSAIDASAHPAAQSPDAQGGEAVFTDEMRGAMHLVVLRAGGYTNGLLPAMFRAALAATPLAKSDGRGAVDDGGAK